MSLETEVEFVAGEKAAELTTQVHEVKEVPDVVEECSPAGEATAGEQAIEVPKTLEELKASFLKEEGLRRSLTAADTSVAEADPSAAEEMPPQKMDPIDAEAAAYDVASKEDTASGGEQEKSAQQQQQQQQPNQQQQEVRDHATEGDEGWQGEARLVRVRRSDWDSEKEVRKVVATRFGESEAGKENARENGVSPDEIFARKAEGVGADARDDDPLGASLTRLAKSHMEQRKRQQHEHQSQFEQQEAHFQRQRQGLQHRQQAEQTQLQMRQQAEYSEILCKLTTESPLTAQSKDVSQQPPQHKQSQMHQQWPPPGSHPGYGVYSGKGGGWKQNHSYGQRYAPYSTKPKAAPQPHW